MPICTRIATRVSRVAVRTAKLEEGEEEKAASTRWLVRRASLATATAP